MVIPGSYDSFPFPLIPFFMKDEGRISEWPYWIKNGLDLLHTKVFSEWSSLRIAAEENIQQTKFRWCWWHKCNGLYVKAYDPLYSKPLF